MPNGTGGFELLVNEIDETITFTPIEALVPNRSNGGGTMLLAGVQYDIKVTDAAGGAEQRQPPACRKRHVALADRHGPDAGCRYRHG